VQITRTTPFRLMTLQYRHIFFTLAMTFMFYPLLTFTVPGRPRGSPC
jgi:hypothetical protein